jgi:hypothetical protein
MENKICLEKFNKKIIFFVIPLCILNFVNAGFASTFLPSEDGKLIFEVQPGEMISYLVYPQNLEKEIKYIKILLNDPYNIVKNNLEESYTIFPNTSGDEFPISFDIFINPDTKNGTLFPLNYEVISLNKNPNKSMVQFSEIVYRKSFYVRAGKYNQEKFPHWTFFVMGGIGILSILGFSIYKIKIKK